MLVTSVRMASLLQGPHCEEDDCKTLLLLLLLLLLLHVYRYVLLALEKAFSKQSNAQQQMRCSNHTDMLSIPALPASPETISSRQYISKGGCMVRLCVSSDLDTIAGPPDEIKLLMRLTPELLGTW